MGGHQREGKKEEEMQLWHRNAPPKEGGGLSRKATVQLDPPTKGGSWEELRKK